MFKTRRCIFFDEIQFSSKAKWIRWTHCNVSSAMKCCLTKISTIVCSLTENLQRNERRSVCAFLTFTEKEMKVCIQSRLYAFGHVCTMFSDAFNWAVFIHVPTCSLMLMRVLTNPFVLVRALHHQYYDMHIMMLTHRWRTEGGITTTGTEIPRHACGRAHGITAVMSVLSDPTCREPAYDV